MALFANIKKWSFRIINNYFLLLAINGILVMFGMLSIAKFDLLIMLAASVITISYLNKGITKLDLFIILFIGIVAFSSKLIYYDDNLWYLGCRQQLFCTIFFFVGKHPQISKLQIFQKGITPFLIVCCLGLVLYVMSPQWYMNYKLQMWQSETGISEDRILEMTRLSAFWQYPYWVSYGCAIMYSYMLINCFTQGFMKKKDAIILMFIAFIAVLTQQRAPLIIIAILTIIFILVGIFKKRKSGHLSLRTSIMYFIILGICMFAIFLTIIDSEMLARLLEKFEVLGNASAFLSNRADIFSDFRSKEITFFGDGIGRYSHAAYNLGKPAITDQQYLKILYETGIFGCVGYGIIIGTVLLNGLRHVQSHIFELSIIFFYLLAMTGANCLAIFDQHSAIFWICCGLICNKYIKQNKFYGKDKKTSYSNSSSSILSIPGK